MKKLSIILSLAALALPVFGQHNLTLYNMKSIPQKFYTNPARQSDAKFFLGIPAISSVYNDYGITFLSFNDYRNSIVKDENGDNVLVLSELTSHMKKHNVVKANTSVDLLSLGLKLGKNYFFANASFHSNARFSMPKDAFQILSDGNGGQNLNRTFNFAFAADVLQYGEIGLGYNRKILDEKLTIGGRLRLIKGLAVVNTAKNDLKFTTDANTFDYILQSDIEINTASSYPSLSLGVPLLIQDPNLWAQSQAFGSVSSVNDINQLLQSGNRGFAVDLGAQYKLTKRIELNASLLNLGKINWNQNKYNIVSENPSATYIYDGLNLNGLDFSDQAIEESLNNLYDTLSSTFKLRSDSMAFSTGLFAQMYVGGNFHLTKNHNAGVLIYGDFYKKRFNPGFTLSWNSKLTRVIGVSATYSMVNNSFTNGGLGFSLNGGPIQYYLVSDNIIGVFKLGEMTSLNFRTGMNFTLGRGEKSLKKQAGKKKKKSS